jgi:TonB family protein
MPEAPAPHEAAPAPVRPQQAPPKIQNQTASSPAPTSTANAAAALDLSGVTLTNDSGGFAMPTGDGSALNGPIGLGRARAPIASTAPAPVRTTDAALVAASDLSEHPRPPSLEGLLRANYPEEARARALGGTASVRARIDRDGVIRSARLISESATGFGTACRRTVLGSRWSAPRAKNGDAVATEIVYTCHFEVE